MAASRSAAFLLATLMLTMGVASLPAGALSGDDERVAPRPVLRGLGAVTDARALEAYTTPSVLFEQNLGQVDPAARFLARTGGATLLFQPAEIVLILPPSSDASAASVVRMSLANGNASPEITASDEAPGVTNYFRGNDPAKWIAGAASFGRIVYDDVYPGVDLAFYGTPDGRLEYDLIVAPGADPSVILWTIDGAVASLSDGGRLVLETGDGSFAFEAPVVYQAIEGVRSDVEGRFVVDPRGIAFAIGDYDASETLVIDPVLSWSTYLGGSGADGGTAVTADTAGNAYVAGFTSSTNFDTTAPSGGGPLGSNGGGMDVFVAKFSPTGTRLWSTYLGGSGADQGQGIAVDANGEAFVTGWTESSDFPKTDGSTFQGGQFDAFLTKLSGAGTVVWSTDIGGSQDDGGRGVAVDPAGDAYFVGYSSSTDLTPIPSTSPANQGVYDVVVAKFASAGPLAYLVTVGGPGSDQGRDIAVDSAGSVYVTGETAPVVTGFPTTPGAFLASPQGGTDAFAAKLSAVGAVVWATILGGTAQDEGLGIAIDQTGSVHLTGRSYSIDFPTIPAGGTPQGDSDAFVTTLDAGGAPTSSTYLGGPDQDIGEAVAVDSTGRVHVTGRTYSTGLATSGAYQTSAAGMEDAFLATFTSGALSYFTYLGGFGEDTGRDVAFGGAQGLYLTGDTFPQFPTHLPHQTGTAGSREAFAMRFDLCPDTNGDGTIDATEAAACAALTPDPCDTNGDGVIGPNAPADCYDECDLNRDGVVTTDEETLCDNDCYDVETGTWITNADDDECFVTTPACDPGSATFAIHFATGAAYDFDDDPIGAGDLRWRVGSAPAPLTAPGPAESIDRHASWAVDGPSRNWINALDGATDPLNFQQGGSSQAPAGVYVYAYDFSLPASATNVLLKLKHSADDSVDVALNGNAPFSTSADPTILTTGHTVSGFVVGGINTLSATVTNDGGHTGFVAEGDITGECGAIPVPCDTNGNGIIEPAEALACCDPCDTDHDGIVTIAEVEACCLNPCDVDRNGIVAELEREQCFDPCDLDRNGVIKQRERDWCLTCDENQDGHISAEERKACPRPCDSNLDGEIDPLEKRRCGICDTNGDGFIDIHERKACEEHSGPCDTDVDGEISTAEKLACDGEYHACDANLNGVIDPIEKKECECFDDCDRNKDGVVDAIEAQRCKGKAPGPHRCDANLDGTVDAQEEAACSQVFHRCDANLDGLVDDAERDACLKVLKTKLTEPVQRPSDEIATRIDGSGIWALLEGALFSGAIKERLPADVRMDVQIARAGQADLTYTAMVAGHKLVSIVTPAEPGAPSYTLSMSEPAALSIINAFDRGRTATLLFTGGFLAVNGESQVDKLALKGASSDVGSTLLSAEAYTAGTVVSYDGISAPLEAAGDGLFKATFGKKGFLVDGFGGRVGYAMALPTGPGSEGLGPTSGVMTNSRQARLDVVAKDPDLREASLAFATIMNGSDASRARQLDRFLEALDRVQGAGTGPASSAYPCVRDADGGSAGRAFRPSDMNRTALALGASAAESVKTKQCPTGSVPSRSDVTSNGDAAVVGDRRKEGS